MGSSISTTGEMLVNCNQPYVLEVDGVTWSPISTSTDGDVYLLTTSGHIVIYVDGKRVFFFENNIVSDFDIQGLGYRQYSGSNIVKYLINQTNYIQVQFAQNCDKVWIVLVGNKTPDELLGYGVTTNNGDANVTFDTHYNRIEINITNVDVSEYCAVFCGNVLLVYLTPAS